MDAISTILSSAASKVLGSFVGQTSYTSDYIIVLGEAGGILRIDYLLYAFEFKSQGLMKMAKNVLLVDYIISAVDTSVLTPSDVNGLVEISYSSLPKEQKL